MKIGTKTILFGVHQFLLHPVILFVAWWKVYGFPADPRLWVAFVVHDLGYWGRADLDSPEDGERHVEFGAGVMRRWFGDEWGDLCLYHSRFYSRRAGRSFSRLCVADKQVIAMEPWWLYLPRAWLSGELKVYMAAGGDVNSKYKGIHSARTAREWYASIQAYCAGWVREHRDFAQDTWTARLIG